MRKKVRRRRSGRRAVCVFAIIVVALVFLYLGGTWLERRAENPEARGKISDDDSTIEYNGKKYRRRRVTSVLLMGIDNDGGQADMLRLIVIDDGARRVMSLPIDRDTMTMVTVLDVFGRRSGERVLQISLSHAFGDGGKQSGELTRDTVSNLLGVPVDHYIALNLNGIAALNDAVGGVTVTLEDDFSDIDPTMTKGATVTLSGRQAEIYARSRMSVGSGTNAERMARQNKYMQGLFSRAVKNLRTDSDFTDSMYDAVADYITTDLSRGEIINIAWASRDYEICEPLAIAGEHKVGSDGFMQFHADEASLRENALALFYEECD